MVRATRTRAEQRSRLDVRPRQYYQGPTFSTAEKRVLHSKGIITTFPKEVIEQARTAKIPEKELARLSENPVPGFSIDPPSDFTCTDVLYGVQEIDDLIHVKHLGGGIRRLRVSIAYVAAVVGELPLVYEEAMRRSSSIYLANGYIPMLPMEVVERTSLLEGQPRLAVTLDVIFNPFGQIIKISLYESMVKNMRAFTYAEAERIRQAGDGEWATLLQEAYILGRQLYKIRTSAEALTTFDQEREIIGENGPMTLHEAEKHGSYLSVHGPMLLFNSLMAHFMAYVGWPAPYRCHESINAHGFYSIENIGHAGLGIDYYLHGSSPLRRAPDLAWQLALRTYLSCPNLPLVEKERIAQHIQSMTKRHSSYPRRATAVTSSVLRSRRAIQMTKEELLRASPGLFRRLLAGALLTKNSGFDNVLDAARERELAHSDMLFMIQLAHQSRRLQDFIINYIEERPTFYVFGLLRSLARINRWKFCSTGSRRIVIASGGKKFSTRMGPRYYLTSGARKAAERIFLADYVRGQLVEVEIEIPT